MLLATEAARVTFRGHSSDTFAQDVSVFPPHRSHAGICIALWFALAVAVAAAPVTSCAQAAAISGPDTVSFTSGALHLRGLLYRPAGKGPFPVILFNHGSGKNYDEQAAAVGPAYAARGFVFFAPSRRGQWLSTATGGYIVDSLDAITTTRGDSAHDRLLVELMKGPQLADVAAALDWIRRQPYVDGQRIVVAGNSFGGIVTVFAAARLSGLYAGLDFAGAAQTWAGSPRLQAEMTEAVEHARIPIFFGQAENDYDLTPSRILSAAMQRAGKPNVMKIFPPFGTTVERGHSFGYYGGDIWGAEVLAFVKNPPRTP